MILYFIIESLFYRVFFTISPGPFGEYGPDTELLCLLFYFAAQAMINIIGKYNHHIGILWNFHAFVVVFSSAYMLDYTVASFTKAAINSFNIVTAENSYIHYITSCYGYIAV